MSIGLPDKLKLSLLDRLLDDEPGNSREAPKLRPQLLREMKDAIRRDLQNLLNTRTRFHGWPESYTELDNSLLNYGLPDFAGLTSWAVEHEEFRRLIEDTVRKFEPRFKEIRVQLARDRDPNDRTLRFRIEVLMYAEPAPEQVVFDSQLEPIDGSIDVRVNQR